MKIKEELLEHYNEREPVEFMQYDVFTEQRPDSVVTPDKDGDWICSGMTTELMTGSYTLRLLVIPDTKKAIVVRGLKKIIEWLERDPELLTKAGREKLDDLATELVSKIK